MVTTCFTGHRPQDLYGFDWKNKKNKELLLIIRDTICNFINSFDRNEEFTFIHGGALGIDQMTFEVLYKLKNTVYKDRKIYLHLAIPFNGYHSKWKNKLPHDYERFLKHLNKADKVIYVDTLEKYTFPTNGLTEYTIAAIKNNQRNSYMLDKSNWLISFFIDEYLYVKDRNNKEIRSGTKNCVKESIKKEIPRISVHPITFKYNKYEYFDKKLEEQLSLF